MIAKLRGLIDQIGTDHVVLDVSGVFYRLLCSERSLAGLPKKGEHVTLHTEIQFRDTGLYLYGFLDEDEYAWFQILTQIQGVGGRVALAILSSLAPHQLALAVMKSDKAALVQAHGVGGKLANRILTELSSRDSFPGLRSEEERSGKKSSSADEQRADQEHVSLFDDFLNLRQDALSALVNLGYGQKDVSSALDRLSDSFVHTPKSEAETGETLSLETVIRLGLKELS